MKEKRKFKIVASIEARMGSSRLPGKVLMDIEGKPVLSRVFERLKRCQSLDGILLATSNDPQDDVLEEWAAENQCPFFRGSEDDVLQRVVDAHKSFGTDIIVEMHGDCVMLDPRVIDMGVEMFLANETDVVSTTWKESFPVGIDVQVFRLTDLASIAETIDDPEIREHVSLHFYRHPEKYEIIHMIAPSIWKGKEYRFILDYPEDLEFIKAVYKKLVPLHGDCFGVDEILGLISENKQIEELNRICQKASGRL